MMKVRTMKNQSLIQGILTSIKKSKRIPSLSSTLEIEMNKIHFRLSAHNGAVVLYFKSWKNCLAFLKDVKKNQFARDINLLQLQELLKEIDLTLYLQNKKFAVLGPRAGFIVPKLLTAASLFVK